MDDEGKANLFLIYFVGLTVYLFMKTDMVAVYLTQATLPMALFAHLLLNPAYLIVVFGIVSWKRDRAMMAFLAGIILVLAIDIISPPRLGILPPTTIETSTATNIDYVFWQAANHFGMAYPLFRTAYYLILPLLLIYLSTKLLGMRAFWQKVSGGS